MFFDQNKGVMNPSFFKVSDFLWDGCEDNGNLAFLCAIASLCETSL
jgi:hypothetical protein